MRNKIKFTIAVMMMLTIVITYSCKKPINNPAPNTPGSQNEFQTQTDDGDQISGEIDAIADDGNTALQTTTGMSGGRVEGNPLCDAYISYDTTGSKKTLTVAYNGKTCDGLRYRVGTVTYSLPAGVQWKDQGAVLTISINLKVSRLKDNKSILLNGTGTVTNATGGLIRDLATLGAVTHDINTEVIKVTFDNNILRTWQVARRRSFTYDNGIVIAISGIHTDGSNTNITEWGVNRKGDAFSTSITQPVVVRQDCNFRIVSGQLTHERLSHSATVTFGLDSTGSPTSCPGFGHYYLKIEWVDINGNPQSLILPY